MQIKHTTSYSFATVKLLLAAGIVAVFFACLTTVAFAQTVDSADSLSQRLALDSLKSYDRSAALLSDEGALGADSASLIDSVQGEDPTLRMMADEQASQSDGQGGESDAPAEDEAPVPECGYATMPAAWIIWMKQISGSIEMSWTPVDGASGYFVYRCALKSGQSVPAADKVARWELVATRAASKGTTWRDSQLKSGVRYAYRVQAYGKTKTYYFSKPADLQQPEGCLSQVPFRSEYLVTYRYADGALTPKSCTMRRVGVASEASIVGFLSEPWLTKYSKAIGSSALKVSWKKMSGVDGYQVQYSKNRLFTSYKKKTLTGASSTTLKLDGLAKSKSYHVRVRAYKTMDGKKVYSPWSHSSTFQSVPTLTLKIQKVKKKNPKSQIKLGAKKTQTMDFEIRSSAGQYLGGYDTVQGSTSDGTYGYYMLYNCNVEKCKIAKVRLKTMKCVKVSKPLRVAHGNAVTYNKKTKRLIVTHLSIDPLAVSCVNPKTLKVEWKKRILFPDLLPGATARQLKNASKDGFGSIAYNVKKGQYVGMLRESHNMVIMDQDFTPLRYVTTEWKGGQVNQNVLSSGSYIMICKSGYTTLWNHMEVYTWDGEYVGKWNLYCGAEAESAYFAKGKLYLSIYHSGDKSFTETKYVKKTVNGVQKVVKKRVSYVFPRSNCVYRVTNF